MGLKISDMDADASVTGVELLAVSDGGVAKSVTVTNISDFAISEIEGISALASVDGNDFVMMLENGTDLKPTHIDRVSQHGIDTMWGKTAKTSPDGTDKLLLLDGSTEKTVTLAYLAAYTLATNEAAILNLADVADGSETITATDYMLVTQATIGKRIQISDLSTIIYAALAAYVKALDVAGTTNDANILYIQQSDVEKKIALSDLLAHAGNVIDGSGTAGYLAKWTNANTLQAGPTIGLAASGFTTGSDTVLPSTALVRGEMDEIINDATLMGAALVDADTFLIDDGGGGTQKKSVMSRLYTYTIETIIPSAVDGDLVAGANADFDPVKLVYAKTATGAGEVIDLNDGTVLGQILTIYLSALGAGDTAVVTPDTAINWTSILLDTQYDIATLQWQGDTVGWAILYTNAVIT